MNILQKISISLFALLVALVPTTVFGANNFVLSADTNFAIDTANNAQATTVVGLNGGAVVSAVTGSNYIDVTMENGSSITFKSPYGFAITGTTTSGSGVSSSFECTSLTDSRLTLSASDDAVVRVQVTMSTAGCTGGGGGGVASTGDTATETEESTESNDTDSTTEETTTEESEDTSSETDESSVSNETESTQEEVTPTGACYEAHPDDQIQRIICEAKVIIRDHVSELPALNKYARSEAKEAAANEFTNKLGSRMNQFSEQAQQKIRNFIVYGTPESRKLGEGERTGVIDSFQAAFGKLPQSETDWEDVIKIGAGRWPSQANATRENWAEARFREVYLRAPDRDNARDDAAVVILAYGMRPNPRNVSAEAVAIKTFKDIFNYAPTTAEDWDMVRAIAYSGAVR